MKVSIGVRLFLVMALAMLTVAAVGVGLVRWRFSGGAPAPVSPAEQQALQGLRQELADAYRKHGGWSFVPADDATRATWLRRQLATVDGQRTAAAGVPSPTLGYRIGLLDVHGRTLATTIELRALSHGARFVRPGRAARAAVPARSPSEEQPCP